ncbi:MAG: hypothetical protein J7619_31460 [Dyadobacter sp.]|uniref:hypothetical protein n=1 Tax=Dyadobacter sp. TaxID=1914288 RepID=UPI001B11F33F|nr:hypothetical protein [Dyadobacter sp.]MBO9617245.1 hypothetical protein [Dyadobacter sp.]
MQQISVSVNFPKWGTKHLIAALILFAATTTAARAQCINFIANGSMETYTNCPNFSNGGTINYATNWKTIGGLAGTYGQLLVYRPGECISNKPVSSWAASTALTGGSDGTNWLGGHNTENWQNTLTQPLPPGNYTFYLDAGNVINSPYVNTNSTLLFYGVKSTDADFSHIPAQLIGSVVVDNVISATNQTWVTRSFNITTTETYDRIEILNAPVVPGNAGAYTYIDNFRLTYTVSGGPDTTICVGATTEMAGAGSGVWSEKPGNPTSTTITDPSSGTTTISGFSTPGVYYFIWTSNGCTDEVAVTVTGPSAPVIAVTDPSCAVPTGSITVESPVSGLTYTLSPGGTSNTTGVFAGLAPATGPYTVKASDGTCNSAASNAQSIGAFECCESDAGTITIIP